MPQRPSPRPPRPRRRPPDGIDARSRRYPFTAAAAAQAPRPCQLRRVRLFGPRTSHPTQTLPLYRPLESSRARCSEWKCLRLHGGGTQCISTPLTARFFPPRDDIEFHQNLNIAAPLSPPLRRARLDTHVVAASGGSLLPHHIILIASGSPPGLQQHLNGSQIWVNDNGCITSIPKCLGQLYGRYYPNIVPNFQIGGGNISMYKVKARKARTIANVILGLDRFVGTLPAWDAWTLYMGRVDPYLTAGCDVCLDVDTKGLKMLEKVQLTFLRRMLGVGSRSMRAVLFSATGIWPIKYRRRPAWNALQESLTLARASNTCWFNDPRIVLSHLHIPVKFNIAAEVAVQYIESVMKNVKLSMEAWIDSEIASSSRVRDLLVGRLEVDKDTNESVKKTLDFRHYLRVKTADHRRALTRMILSGHSLAIERRRWKERGKEILPREWRLCRFCYLYIEDPAHAVFKCTHPELLPIRQVFLAKLYTEIPELDGTLDATNAFKFFHDLLPQRKIAPLLAKLAYDVLKIFELLLFC
ncbi:hypothetical protein B0H16DRAFT_1893334 [Mycena metata]|uniref:Uncharacterized protein n=1 Tax=Mycena metata TaxID=1033252 RepID=A0AAD7I136_9AGAR|nr:hypothetical protein B0H16DRAFT_1893334 [Mycena metata]